MQIKIFDQKVNFESYGSGNTLLLLHGWGQSLTEWYGLLKELGSGYKVILLDLPGFGNSEIKEPNWGCKDYCEFVHEFLRELDIDKVTLVGHSMGGKISCFFAHKHPKFVEKLILVASSGVDNKSLVTRIKIITLSFFGKFIPDSIKKSLKSRFGSKDYLNAGRMRKVLVKVTNEYVFELLPEISAKTMIIWGSDDKTLPVVQAKKFKSLLPNSFIKIIWGEDHFPFRNNPKYCAKVIKEFIDD